MCLPVPWGIHRIPVENTRLIEYTTVICFGIESSIVYRGIPIRQGIGFSLHGRSIGIGGGVNEKHSYRRIGFFACKWFWCRVG